MASEWKHTNRNSTIWYNLKSIWMWFPTNRCKLKSSLPRPELKHTLQHHPQFMVFDSWFVFVWKLSQAWFSHTCIYTYIYKYTYKCRAIYVQARPLGHLRCHLLFKRGRLVISAQPFWFKTSVCLGSRTLCHADLSGPVHMLIYVALACNLGIWEAGFRCTGMHTTWEWRFESGLWKLLSFRVRKSRISALLPKRLKKWIWGLTGQE